MYGKLLFSIPNINFQFYRESIIHLKSGKYIKDINNKLIYKITTIITTHRPIYEQISPVKVKNLKKNPFNNFIFNVNKIPIKNVIFIMIYLAL